MIFICIETSQIVYFTGIQIFKLDKKEMGCVFALSALISVLATFIIVIVSIAVLIRKWDTIKFYLFVHFNILTDDDGPENLDIMKFDGFVTYR